MWRQSVNGVLRRLTGLQLQRASTAAEIAKQGRALERKVVRLTRQLEKANTRLGEAKARLGEATTQLGETTAKLEKVELQREKAEAKAKQQQRRATKARGMPTHYDKAAVEILRRVEPRTMTDHAKLYGLVEATRYVVKGGIPGDIVECGVWRGGSMQAVALTLIEQGATDRALHLFDTFEGMPPPTEKDTRSNGSSAEELLATHDKDHRVWGVAGLDDVQEAMRETAYPEDQIHFHKGLVEDTVPSRAPAQISLLRLDTDWYESTRHELENLYDHLSPGGVLIIDDYGDWDGARLATEEFLNTLPEPLLLLPIGTGRLAIKPRS